MFKKPTVFILGAGASWHYGYPTGENLVKKVIEKAHYLISIIPQLRQDNQATPEYVLNIARKLNQDSARAWLSLLEEAGQIQKRLTYTNPLIIDYFLGQNPKIQELGKILIAWVILECEKKSNDHTFNFNRKEDLENSPDHNEQMRGQRYHPSNSKCKDDWCRFIIHQLAYNCKKDLIYFLTKLILSHLTMTLH